MQRNKTNKEKNNEISQSCKDHNARKDQFTLERQMQLPSFNASNVSKYLCGRVCRVLGSKAVGVEAVVTDESRRE